MKTKIEWCDRTWNPISGCSPVSEACVNCYASRMATRLRGRYGYPTDEPFKVTFHEDKLNEPFGWKKPQRVFVSSMGDLFHSDVEMRWEKRILDVIDKCPQHTFIVLTKRPKNILIHWMKKRPNVWAGITAENQQRANERIPELLKLRNYFPVLFVSVEPMLTALDISPYLGCASREKMGINFVICGAETGPGARYMNPQWARDLLAQCRAADVPFFMKKLSNRQPIPDDLMVREWPVYG